MNDFFHTKYYNVSTFAAESETRVLTLKQKQIFLRENVLDKGFNTDEFMNLLHSKKGESGLDLNNWSMSELSSVVSEFTSMLNQNENINNNSNDSNKNENRNEKDEDYEQICLQKFKEQQLNEQQQEFEKCQKIKNTELSKNNNVMINISFPEKIEKGVFKKSFISYLIETFPLKYQVRKRFSDFEWLQSILNSQFTNCVIPPIPHKNYGDRFTEELILKRTRMLKKFLDGILIHPIMKHSEILI